jgi:hypothetical protein
VIDHGSDVELIVPILGGDIQESKLFLGKRGLLKGGETFYFLVFFTDGSLQCGQPMVAART